MAYATCADDQRVASRRAGSACTLFEPRLSHACGNQERRCRHPHRERLRGGGTIVRREHTYREERDRGERGHEHEIAGEVQQVELESIPRFRQRVEEEEESGEEEN